MSEEGRPEGDQEGIGVGAWLAGLALGAIVASLMVAFYNIGKTEGEREAANAPVTEAVRAVQSEGSAPAKAQPEEKATGTSGEGRELFATGCGSCHTLAAADTSGTSGPDLDDLSPSRRQVLDAIADGGATGTVMPAGIYSGSEAERVADFVASQAGR